MKRTLTLISLALVLGVLQAPSIAQSKPVKPQPDQKQDKKAAPKAADKDEDSKDDDKKDSKADDYAHEIKGLTKHEGAFTFYERKNEILLELPEANLGKLFLVQASFDTGVNAEGLQAGDPVGMFGVDAFKWVKQDDENIWLERPNERFRWSKSDPLNIAAKRSFPEAVLGSFHIEATNPDKKLLLINITPLFYGDIFRLNELVSTGLSGAYMLDREKSGPEKVLSFPDNSVIRMKLYYMSARGPEQMNPLAALFGFQPIPNQLEDDRSAPITVSYNMWYRNDDGYVPRVADSRIGYFTQDFYSVDRFMDQDRTERYIMRFNLQKKDPKAALSEPVKPIVWTIDPSVPPEYRDAVKQGILRWNKAFEQIGFKDAIQVQDAPKNDPNYDHADGRYNVVRWTMSEDSPYAVTWIRTDPFTGEILNASITFDANMLAYVEQEHENMALPVAMQSASRPMDALLMRDPNRKLTSDEYLWATDTDLLKMHFEQQLHKFGFGAMECEYGPGLAENAAFCYSAVLAQPGLKIDKVAYAKEFIADTICHEAGHTLGLRHNFMGTTNLTTAQLGDDSITSKEGNSASVMDYVPVNVMAVLKGSGNFYSPTIGRYDDFAIKYGYTETGAKTPSDEQVQLDQIADQSGLHGLGYETDENADNWDPYVVQFDEGKDPLNYAAKMLEASSKVMNYAEDALPRVGQSYSKRTLLILTSLMEDFNQGRIAARFVGGMHLDRNFDGDQDQKDTLAPVDSAFQREALHLIVRDLFSAHSFQFSPDVEMNLTLDPQSENSPTWTAPLRSIISSQQERLLTELLSADTTDRICENQYKWGNDKSAYTIGEHYGALLGAIFSEIGANVNISPTRRDLQSYFVSAMEIQASAPFGAVNDDVREICSDSLRRLSARIGEQLQHSKSLNDMTVVHLRDTKADIDKFLARQDVAVPGR